MSASPDRRISPDEGYRPERIAALLKGHAQGAGRGSPLSRLAAKVRASRWARPATKAAFLGVVLALLAVLGVTLGGSSRTKEANAATPRASAPTATASAPPPPTASASAAPPGDPPPAERPEHRGVLDDGRVVLNVATEDELTKLPHVGPKRARDIVALRTKLGGRFKAVTDLLRVKGLGRKTLAKLAPKVVLDPPKE